MVRLHDPGKLPRPNPRHPRDEWRIAINDAVADDLVIGNRYFPARFTGVCPCGEKYEPGDMVHYIDRTTVAHEACDGTEVAPLPETERVMAMGPKQVQAARSRMCPRCFTERLPSGLCGNCDV